MIPTYDRVTWWALVACVIALVLVLYRDQEDLKRCLAASCPAGSRPLRNEGDCYCFVATQVRP